MSLSFLILLFRFLLTIFACVMLLVTLILFAVLFIPVTYDVYADKQEEFKANVKVSWLFKTVSFVYKANGSKENEYYFSILLIKLRANKKKRQKPGAKQSSYEAETDNVKETPLSNRGNSETSGKEQPQFSARRHEGAGGMPEESRKKGKQKKHRRQKNKSDTETSLLDTIKKIWEYQYKKEIAAQVVLLIKRLAKALSYIKITGQLKFGTKEPHLTGYILGLCFFLTGINGLDISPSADFEKVHLTGTIVVKGKFFVAALVFPALAFIFNRHIWKLIKKFIFRKD